MQRNPKPNRSVLDVLGRGTAVVADFLVTILAKSDDPRFFCSALELLGVAVIGAAGTRNEAAKAVIKISEVGHHRLAPLLLDLTILPCRTNIRSFRPSYGDRQPRAKWDQACSTSSSMRV